MNENEPSDNLHPIVFVGAGPGAPDLITLRGRRLLGRADLVVYAGSLVPDAVIEHAPDRCETLSSASMTLSEIMEAMVQAQRSGDQVVRVHSGDPSIYGAIQEQMQRLDEMDVPYRVVPGVSSFTAAAAELKSELTVPETVQSIILTRASGRAKTPEAESLDRLAEAGCTICVFLSAKHARRVQEQLLEHYDPDTPAAVCYRVTRPDQKLVITRLDRLARAVGERGFKRTTLFLVGDAIQARSRARSGVYDPDHLHVFRPEKKE